MRTLGGPAGRTGASLVELLAALVLFAIVGAATLRALDRQARLHAGLMAILEARSQHAAAHEALAVELRGLSPPGGDLARLADSAVAFRLPVGGGVVCALDSGSLDLAPDSLASGQVLARLRTAPQAGDTAWLLDEGAGDDAGDDRWVPLAVAAAARSPGRCDGSPLVDPVADAGRPAWRFALSGAGPPPTARPGTVVRLTRMARFALYRGGTGEHWLGFAEWNPATAAWVTIQPVSGPYTGFGSADPSASGVAFAGRDSSGMRTTAPLGVAGLAIATRSLTAAVVRMDGAARGRKGDSLHSFIALRNAR